MRPKLRKMPNVRSSWKNLYYPEVTSRDQPTEDESKPFLPLALDFIISVTKVIETTELIKKIWRSWMTTINRWWKLSNRFCFCCKPKQLTTQILYLRYQHSEAADATEKIYRGILLIYFNRTHISSWFHNDSNDYEESHGFRNSHGDKEQTVKQERVLLPKNRYRLQFIFKMRYKYRCWNSFSMLG